MKKSYLFLGLLATTFVTANAQLKVTSDGCVSIVGNSSSNGGKLTISDTQYNSYPNNCIGVLSKLSDASSYFNIGVMGSVDSSDGYFNLGVRGVTAGNTNGRNFGLFGGLMDSYNGAGLYATTYSTPTRVLGRYAAYFEGATNISGTLTAMEMVTPSDERLMENVVLLGGSRSSEELDNLMDIDVFQYSYTDKALIGEANETDSIRISVRTCNSFKKESGREHYGISANKLQKIYPALVREGQDGYLGINYVELVPILIRSIQELKAELDEVKGNDGCARRAPLVNAVTTPATYQARLYQNTPNPFTAQTEIRFSLPDDVKDAYICIFDMTGKMLKKTPISSDMSSITVNGYELDEGIYLYSLVVNGQEIDTKRMVLTK